MLPGMRIPRLDPEAGLARGCGERAHPVLSRIIRNRRVPGGPL